MDANLCKASLIGAILEGTDFRSAKLNEASFVQANLVGAQFANADLAGANFANADISGADFIGNGEFPPAHGLTQGQLESACADPDNGPLIDGLIDPESKRPLKRPKRSCS